MLRGRGLERGWDIWERPDWLNASLALPAALGRVLRAAREREQPHVMRRPLAAVQKAPGLESQSPDFWP